MKSSVFFLLFMTFTLSVWAQKPCEDVRLYFPRLERGESNDITELEVGSLMVLSLLGAEKCTLDADYDLQGFTIDINGKSIESLRGYETHFFPKISAELEKLKAGDSFTITGKVSMRIDGEFHKYLSIKGVFKVVP